MIETLTPRNEIETALEVSEKVRVELGGKAFDLTSNGVAVVDRPKKVSLLDVDVAGVEQQSAIKFNSN